MREDGCLRGLGRRSRPGEGEPARLVGDTVPGSRPSARAPAAWTPRWCWPRRSARTAPAGLRRPHRGHRVDRSWYRPPACAPPRATAWSSAARPSLAVLGEPGEMAREPYFGARRHPHRRVLGRPGRRRREEALAALAERPADDDLARWPPAGSWPPRAPSTLVRARRRRGRGRSGRARGGPVGGAARGGRRRRPDDRRRGRARAGSRPLAAGGALDRARRDFELFLNQHRLDPLLAQLGRRPLAGERPAGGRLSGPTSTTSTGRPRPVGLRHQRVRARQVRDYAGGAGGPHVRPRARGRLLDRRVHRGAGRRCRRAGGRGRSPAAVGAARERTAGARRRPGRQAALPEDMPGGRVRPDRLLRGPLLLGRAAAGARVDTLAGGLEPGGLLLAVHWTEPTREYPLQGHEVHRALAARPDLRPAGHDGPTTGSTCFDARVSPARGGHRRRRPGRAGDGPRLPRGRAARAGHDPVRRAPPPYERPPLTKDFLRGRGGRARAADRGRAVVRGERGRAATGPPSPRWTRRRDGALDAAGTLPTSTACWRRAPSRCGCPYPAATTRRPDHAPDRGLARAPGPRPPRGGHRLGLRGLRGRGLAGRARRRGHAWSPPRRCRRPSGWAGGRRPDRRLDGGRRGGAA